MIGVNFTSSQREAFRDAGTAEGEFQFPSWHLTLNLDPPFNIWMKIEGWG